MTDNQPTIEQLRAQIDTIDAQIASLFEQRMSCSNEVGRIKGKTDRPTLDTTREQQKINAAKNLISKKYQSQFQALLKLIINASRESQNALRANLSNGSTPDSVEFQLTLLFDPAIADIAQIVDRITLLGFKILSINSRTIAEKDLLEHYGHTHLQELTVILKCDLNASTIQRLTSTFTDITVSSNVLELS